MDPGQLLYLEIDRVIAGILIFTVSDHYVGNESVPDGYIKATRSLGGSFDNRDIRDLEKAVYGG